MANILTKAESLVPVAIGVFSLEKSLEQFSETLKSPHDAAVRGLRRRPRLRLVVTQLKALLQIGNLLAIKRVNDHPYQNADNHGHYRQG